MMTPTFYPNSLVNETLIGLNMSLFAAFCFLMKICESFDLEFFLFFYCYFQYQEYHFNFYFRFLLSMFSK